MFSIRSLLALIIMLICIILIGLIFLFPEQGFTAATRGVTIWWDILFPALFPFFVISEMLLGLGIVHFLGTLLDPMMRPLFRVPGIGGFVMAMGFASGYPVGARLTSQLWEQKLVNQVEGERLVSFTTTADPIFLIGAVSIGLFHDASLAAVIALSHYGAALLLALIMRFHGNKQDVSDSAATGTKNFLLIKAFEEMHQARIHDSRPIGLLLQQAVQTSFKLVFMIGGLVVFFSVLLELFTLVHLMDLLFSFVHHFLRFIHLPTAVDHALVNGFFEVTIGVNSIVNAASSVPLSDKVAVALFILSWSGLSVHAQIVSLMQHTSIRYWPFAAARIVHGFISAALVYLLWTPLQPLRAILAHNWPAFTGTSHSISLKWIFPISGLLFFSVFLMIIVLFCFYSIYQKIKRTL